MTTATLYRQYFNEHTAGVIPFKDQLIYTVERPWICDDPEETRGGKPFVSCIPEGTYKIDQFTRSNGDQVWALWNHELGVFTNKFDRLYDTDRYACLIHSANFARQVNGCIAPGLGVRASADEYMVSHSRAAILRLDITLADITHLEITSYETLKKKTEN